MFRSTSPPSSQREDFLIFATLHLSAALKQMPIAVHTEDANAQHYEVPTSFYQLVLGKRLKYRSASTLGSSPPEVSVLHRFGCAALGLP